VGGAAAAVAGKPSGARGQEARGAGAGKKRERREPGEVPDDARFVDLDPESAPKIVGGAKAAQYDSADEDDEAGGASFAESQQAAIDRQAEAIVLGQMLLNPAKRRALEDAAYNRHTHNDRMLPQWFLDDEKKYAKPAGYGLALPDDLVDKAKNGLKDITARTLGKVAEAKARKQRRLQRALTKLKKKANAVASKEDLSEREKAREVEKMYKKKLQPKEKGKTLVVGKRFQAGSAGKTGHGIKLVDKRSRSDAKGKKRAEAKNKAKGKTGTHGGPGGNGRKGSRQHKGKQYNRR